jgi:hypothetical protein
MKLKSSIVDPVSQVCKSYVILFDGNVHNRVVIVPMLRSFRSGAAQGLPNVSAAIKVDENNVALIVEHNAGRVNVIMDELKRVKMFNGN